jgi:hypothetical protein
VIKNAMPERTWSRRRVLIGTGTALAATTGSIALTSDNASATVNGEFSIPNGEATLTDESLSDVRLSCDAVYSYDANAPIHGVELELHAGATPDTVDMIARHERTDISTDQLDGEATLSGSLINTSDFEIQNFEPDSGELTTGVVAELRFYALRNGDVAAEAIQTEAFEVTVSKKDLEVTMTVGGTGEVTFEVGNATS